jgi:hypothetical protein
LLNFFQTFLVSLRVNYQFVQIECSLILVNKLLNKLKVTSSVRLLKVGFGLIVTVELGGVPSE